MAAPYVASKGTASAVTTGAATPTYPASIAADDIVFLLAISHQPVSIGVINTPTDFTEVAQGTYANSGATNQGRVALFWRRASGSLTGTVSVSRTGDTGVDGVLYSQIYRVVGAKTTGDPWDAVTTDYGPGNATVDIPDVTVSGAERCLIAFIAQADNASTVDPPSGYVGLVSDTTATGTDAELRCVHKRNVDDASATTATGGETEGWGVFHLSMIPASTYSAPSIVLTGDALRMDGAQDVLRLDYADSTGLLYCTVTCWAKISVDRNNYSTIFAIEDGAGHSTAYNELITDTDGTTMSVYDHVTGDVANVQAMTVGTWYAFAMKITASAWKSYVGTEGFTSLTTGTGALTNILFNDLFGVGSTTFTASETLNGQIAMFRVWSAALSDAEVKAELQSSSPVRINDLVGAWLPLGVGSGTELDATYGNNIVSRGVGTPDWTFEAGPKLHAMVGAEVTSPTSVCAADLTASGGSTVTATIAVTSPTSTTVTAAAHGVGATSTVSSPTSVNVTAEAHGVAVTSASDSPVSANSTAANHAVAGVEVASPVSVTTAAAVHGVAVGAEVISPVAVNAAAATHSTGMALAVESPVSVTVAAAVHGVAVGAAVASPVATHAAEAAHGVAVTSSFDSPVSVTVAAAALGVHVGASVTSPVAVHAASLSFDAGVTFDVAVSSPVSVSVTAAAHGVATTSVVASPVSVTVTAAALGVHVGADVSSPVAVHAASLTFVDGVAVNVAVSSPVSTSVADAVRGVGITSTATSPTGVCISSAAHGVSIAFAVVSPVSACSASLAQTSTEINVVVVSPASVCTAESVHGVGFACSGVSPAGTWASALAHGTVAACAVYSPASVCAAGITIGTATLCTVNVGSPTATCFTSIDTPRRVAPGYYQKLLNRRLNAWRVRLGFRGGRGR